MLLTLVDLLASASSQQNFEHFWRGQTMQRSSSQSVQATSANILDTIETGS